MEIFDALIDNMTNIKSQNRVLKDNQIAPSVATLAQVVPYASFLLLFIVCNRSLLAMVLDVEDEGIFLRECRTCRKDRFTVLFKKEQFAKNRLL